MEEKYYVEGRLTVQIGMTCMQDRVHLASLANMKIKRPATKEAQNTQY